MPDDFCKPMTFDELATQHNGRDDTLSPMWFPADYAGFIRGYGTDLYQITEADIERLKAGEIMGLNGGVSEYGMYVRLKRPFKTPEGPDAQ